MVNLGVELQPEAFVGLIHHGGKGAVWGGREAGEAGRKVGDMVPMRHPDGLTPLVEQRICRGDV